MTSTRLPGKILKSVCGRSLLDYHVSRLQQSRLIDRLVVATTINLTDDPVEYYCISKKIACVRGSEDDVLSRYALAVQEYSADVIVRVTSDCPLIDPVLLDQVIRYFLDHQDQYDYVTLGEKDYPRGLDVEVFSRNALETAHAEAKASHEREHVTPYIYGEGSPFRCAIFHSRETSGHHRWCVDEPADFDLIAKILTSFAGGDDFSWQECLARVEENPDWFALNSDVEQKTLPEG
ncbi:Spore coat polysaccharide biosynthesis protein spsF [hydrothermal vent metagenome]|uniref:Spore coat polysaccharide biosynthesis protein spsF n=1 Tax=hydrothermal vent metagenome TaxID=652676 RepID=A0A3B0QYW2_9ZZZZ